MTHGGGNAFKAQYLLSCPAGRRGAGGACRGAAVDALRDHRPGSRPVNTPLAGVSVEAVSDVAGDQSHIVSTDADGSFRLSDLSSGNYVMTVTLPEFQTFKREGISLSPGMNASMVVVLRPSPIRD